jgi:beta-glucosidase-like glycosyl hydrolase
LKYEGVILSDDLEMKALANDYQVPESAVLAIEAGCDGLLICAGDVDVQAAALEALVHAVESERIAVARRRCAGPPAARQGAVPRCRRRASSAWRQGPSAGARARRAQEIAGEMARFV